MVPRVAITGYGIISSIGNNKAITENSLINLNSGLRHTQYIDTIYQNIFPFGEVPYTNEELFHLAQIKKPIHLDRTSLLGIIAFKECIQHANISTFNNNAAFYNATTVGGLCEVENKYLDLIDRNQTSKIALDHFNLECAICTERIIEEVEFPGLATTLSTACSSSANAIIMGARTIEQGISEMAICGGTDGLSKFTINGFNSLKNMDPNPCAPFDENRNGLNLGEGAAYLVLESEFAALKRSATIYGYLKGYANISESYHATAPSPQGIGAQMAMQKALEKATLQPDEIQYINAHGTATINNDLAEANAINNLFHNIPVSSTKPYTGHTLAAAGSIEAVISLMSIKLQTLFPTLNFKTPMQDVDFIPLQHLLSKKIEYVMSNSFGFSGSNSTLIFSNT